MPKAILELEMPENCEECPCSSYDYEASDFFCDALFLKNQKDVRCLEEGRRPDCPLKLVNIEKLAELEHEQWMSWAKTLMETENISESRKQRWKKYMVSYDALPEDMKEQDRKWARKVLKLILFNELIDFEYDKVLEKQKPKKVIIMPDKYRYGRCPICGRIFWNKRDVGYYCDLCGQRLEIE